MENRQLLMIGGRLLRGGRWDYADGYRAGRLRFPRTARQGRRFGTGSDRTTAGWNQRIGAGSADAAAAQAGSDHHILVCQQRNHPAYAFFGS